MEQFGFQFYIRWKHVGPGILLATPLAVLPFSHRCPVTPVVQFATQPLHAFPWRPWRTWPRRSKGRPGKVQVWSCKDYATRRRYMWIYIYTYTYTDMYTCIFITIINYYNTTCMIISNQKHVGTFCVLSSACPVVVAGQYEATESLVANF